MPAPVSQAVIGAGAAGLVATRELLREGHKVTVFEQNDNLGGIWNYQEECETEDLVGRNPKRKRVHSSMWVATSLFSCAQYVRSLGALVSLCL